MGEGEILLNIKHRDTTSFLQPKIERQMRHGLFLPLLYFLFIQ